MTGNAVIVAGIEIPSRNPAFLAVVGVHVLLGLACTITGIIAMLSAKRAGRHPLFGSIYFWCLSGVFVTASALAAVRWAEDYYLFILGTLAFAAAYLGRMARRKRWSNWVMLHITGMGTSYSAADCLLCGQRKETTPLERPSAHRLLAGACCGWCTTDCSRTVLASFSAASASITEEPSSVKTDWLSPPKDPSRANSRGTN
jgi:hypothetical protein